MGFTRKAVMTVADNPGVTKFFQSSRVTRGLVSRFVAGETVDSALDAARNLAASGITTTLDLLGENVDNHTQARAAADAFVNVLRRQAGAGLEPNISVKLTMLGLDLGRDMAVSHLEPVLEAAREVDGFVRFDMEGSPYTAVTMSILEEMLAAFGHHVGTVIQTYLRRAADDVERCIALGARVRLVKGAYAEPADVAFQDRIEVDGNYARLARRLLTAGKYPALATHDMALVRSAIEHVRREGIDPGRFEFQMLYGVRRDQQKALVNDGYRMRVYVPFGTEWYPYFSRRIAERPANAFFVLRQLAG